MSSEGKKEQNHHILNKVSAEYQNSGKMARSVSSSIFINPYYHR